MIGSLGYSIRGRAILAALFLFAPLVCANLRAADKDKDKDKPEKEKKEKIEPWVEIRSAHFIVASDGGEKMTRRFENDFESLLHEFQATMPHARVSNGILVRILVAKDGESFGRMAPEFPFDKRREREQPPGMFVSGPEKTYIGIRANAPGRFRYSEIIQNYAKYVLKLSYRDLPPWLEEGYSTVYENLTFTDRGLRMERPDPNDLSVLSESPLLPLDTVLRVDRKSPFYSPGNKDSVYFAESRVLVHMLLSDPEYAFTGALERYVTSVESGADWLQAARDAFGDLNQLQAKLDAYVKNVSAPPVELPNAAGSDPSSTPRTLTPAEYEARMADFLALRRRVEDAQDKLEEALMNEPSLAEAEQSLGFLLLRNNDWDEAQKHLERAAQLDSFDALNFYGLGLLAMANADKGGARPEAAEDFEKAAKLNPEFAPPWYYLAQIYSQRDDTMSKALDDAQRAASLVPGDAGYQLQVAAVLARLGQRDEARKTAALAQETATDKATARKAGELVAQMTPPPAPPAPVSRPSSPAVNAPAKPSSEPGLRIERKTEPESKPSTSSTVPPPASRTTPAPAPAPQLFADSSKVYSMVGTITVVNCAGAPQVQLTLKAEYIAMKLHADNLDKVEIKSAGSSTPAKGMSCSSLRGRTARISYHLVSQKPWDGEMQEVELRSLP